MTYDELVAVYAAAANPEKAAGAMKFFQTGPGQYGEGDIFLGGLTVPQQRAYAKQARGLPLTDIEQLLDSQYHEHRLTALFVLGLQYQSGDDDARQDIVDFYLHHLPRVNNWDLVDSSAYQILGRRLSEQHPDADNPDDIQLLVTLAGSPALWERRVAMVACFAFTRNSNPYPALLIAQQLQADEEDLLHKAVGWMLREVGKRCGQDLLNDWLLTDQRYQQIPRTMLRYAIERYSQEDRQKWLHGRM